MRSRRETWPFISARWISARLFRARWASLIRIRDDFGGRKNICLASAEIFPSRGVIKLPPSGDDRRRTAPGRLVRVITCQRSRATAHHEAVGRQALRLCAVGPQRTKVSRTLGNHHTTYEISRISPSYLTHENHHIFDRGRNPLTSAQHCSKR